MDDSAFGQRVRQARLNLSARLGRQVSQLEIARELDVAGATISRWEAGEKEPDLRTIAELARVLGVSPAWLAFGDANGAATHTEGPPRTSAEAQERYGLPGPPSPPTTPPATKTAAKAAAGGKASRKRT